MLIERSLLDCLGLLLLWRDLIRGQEITVDTAIIIIIVKVGNLLYNVTKSLRLVISMTDEWRNQRIYARSIRLMQSFKFIWTEQYGTGWSFIDDHFAMRTFLDFLYKKISYLKRNYMKRSFVS